MVTSHGTAQTVSRSIEVNGRTLEGKIAIIESLKSDLLMINSWDDWTGRWIRPYHFRKTEELHSWRNRLKEEHGIRATRGVI